MNSPWEKGCFQKNIATCNRHSRPFNRTAGEKSRRCFVSPAAITVRRQALVQPLNGKYPTIYFFAHSAPKEGNVEDFGLSRCAVILDCRSSSIGRFSILCILVCLMLLSKYVLTVRMTKYILQAAGTSIVSRQNIRSCRRKAGSPAVFPV